MRVLVVEDDDIVADAISRGLTAAKFSVHRVASAEAARGRSMPRNSISPSSTWGSPGRTA